MNQAVLPPEQEPPQMIDDDQITKSLVETFFQKFMEWFCPEHAELIDLSTVSFLKQEHFADVPAGERKQLDVLAQARLKGGRDEEIEECFLIHTEKDASRKDRDFPLRMYLYYG